MQLSTLIGQIIESGKVTISTNDTEALEINAANKKIDINAVNKKFVKETIATMRKGTKNKGVLQKIKGSIDGLKSVKGTFDVVKDAAEELQEAGITVTFSYKGDIVVTIGSDANPKISRLATKTNAIEINSPRRLLKLGI